MTSPDLLVDVAEAFGPESLPDDRAQRVAVLRQYRWSFDKSTGTFHKDSYHMSAGVVRLLPLDDLEYSCAHPERVWP
jgi:hypothetical protein